MPTIKLDSFAYLKLGCRQPFMNGSWRFRKMVEESRDRRLEFRALWLFSSQCDPLPHFSHKTRIADNFEQIRDEFDRLEPANLCAIESSLNHGCLTND